MQTHKKTTRFFAEPGSEHPLPCDDRLHQNCAHGGRNAVLLVRNLTLATKPTRTTLQVPAREETVSVCKRTKYCQTCLALRALRLCYVRHGHQRRAFRITRSCVWLSSQAQLCSWDHCTMNRHVSQHTHSCLGIFVQRPVQSRSACSESSGPTSPTVVWSSHYGLLRSSAGC